MGKAVIMKKSLAITLTLCTFALAFGLVACGGSSGSASSAASSGAASSSASASSESVASSSAAAASDSVSSSAATSSASSASASESADEPSESEYNRAVALFDEGKFYSAKLAFENSKYEDWEQRAAECVQPMPETGELFHDENMTSDNMILNFIVNEEDADKAYYITVYTKDNVLVESLFIKGSGSVETHIPGGEYYIKDSVGTEWYGTDEQFGPDGYYETMVFDEVEGDRHLTSLQEGYVWDITINNTEEVGRGIGSEQESWENRS